MKELNLLDPTQLTQIDLEGIANNQRIAQEVFPIPSGLAKAGMLMENRDLPVGRVVKFVCEEVSRKTPVKITFPEGEGPFPIVLYVHGGGFVGGMDLLDDPAARTIANRVGAAVVDATYVLAPKDPYPAALLELHELLAHLIANAADYDLDGTRVAVAGTSAGAALAMALCELAHRTGETHIEHGIFIYPAVDQGVIGSDNFDEKSDYSLTGDVLKVMIRWYVPEEADATDMLLSPTHIPLDHLPPFTLVTGRRDPLNKVTRAYLAKVLESGHDATIRTFENVGHGFMELPGNEAHFRETIDLVCHQLERAFAGEHVEAL